MLDQLSLLAGAEDVIVSLGPPPAHPSVRPAAVVHRPMGSAWLAGRCKLAAGSAEVLHAWSAEAARALLAPSVRESRGLVLSLPCAPRRAELSGPAQWSRCERFRVTVPTEAARRRLTAAGSSPEAVHVLPPPAAVPEERTDCRVRDELGVGDDDVLLASPAPMTRDAGAKYAPWVHAVLRQIRPDVRLILPGGGPAERNVRFYVGSTGCGGEVFLTGDRYPRGEVLAAADVAVFLFERDCGLAALVAAMSAGVPIVASRTPEVAEAAPDGEAAALVRPCDPRDASGGVLRLLEDRSLAERLGRAAQARARKMFDPAASRKSLEAIYADVASSVPGIGASSAQ